MNIRLPVVLSAILLFVLFFSAAQSVRAEDAGAPKVPSFVENVTTEAPKTGTAIGILAVMTLLSIIPALLVMVTSFTRTIIVLSFLRHALSTQQTPPNVVLTGISIFLTIFIMAPVIGKVQKVAVEPYMRGTITAEVAFEKGLQPIREFMGRQTRQKDLALMIELSHAPRPETLDDVPTATLIPAFMLSELRAAFQMGFLLFIPFVVLDMVISAVLMALGMSMLPPAMISLPMKLLLFVLADGWALVIKSLVLSFDIVR